MVLVGKGTTQQEDDGYDDGAVARGVVVAATASFASFMTGEMLQVVVGNTDDTNDINNQSPANLGNDDEVDENVDPAQEESPPSSATPLQQRSEPSSSPLVPKSAAAYRSFRQCLRRWPRTLAILYKILLLWTLILWALSMGYVLSKLEGPDEVAANNVAMQERYGRLLNNWTFMADDGNQTAILPDVNDVEDLQQNQLLSFNWIRCWDQDQLGNPNPWSPTPAQINASANQGAFFRQQWIGSQQELLQQYVIDRSCGDLSNDNNSSTNSTRQECIREATAHSVQNATGGSNCATNTGAAGWFWFTVMTTVGYGNQSPVTMGGRALVGALGWLSIIAFGAITILSSNNWTAIVDDLFVYRMNKMAWVSRPAFAVPVWGLIGCGWILHIASRAQDYWSERIPGFEATTADSIWFGYITTLTVGLGDFYLQPEGMFLSDVFAWSSLMLTGFVLVSTFLGKVSDLATSFFPANRESFGDYLQRTDACTGKVVKLPPDGTLKMLQEVVTEEEAAQEIVLNGHLHSSYAVALDGTELIEHQLEVLRQKKNLLERLLARTEVDIATCLDKCATMPTSALRHKEKSQHAQCASVEP